jgi:hypothetical protein
MAEIYKIWKFVFPEDIDEFKIIKDRIDLGTKIKEKIN